MTGPAPLRVAAAQLPSVPGDVAANAEAAARAVRDAAAQGCRLLVLPELFLCGYDFDVLAGDQTSAVLDAEDLESEAYGRLGVLREACARSEVSALVGTALARGDRRTISVLAVDGRVRAVFDKQHLLSSEAEHFDAGDDGAVLSLHGWPLGLSVCYDGCFPEHARAAADAGALAYVAPVAYVNGGQHRRDIYYRARAVENGMFVLVSGLVGACGSEAFSGGSAIIDPEGRVLDAVPDGRTGLAVATLDVADLHATRAAHQMHAHHRADLGQVRTLS